MESALSCIKKYALCCKHFDLFPCTVNVGGEGILWWLEWFFQTRLFTLWQRFISIGKLTGCMLFTVFLGNISRIGDVSLSYERFYVLGVCMSFKAICEDLWILHLRQNVKLLLPDYPDCYSSPQIALHPPTPLQASMSILIIHPTGAVTSGKSRTPLERNVYFLVAPIYKMGRSVLDVGSPFAQSAYAPDAIYPVYLFPPI